MGLLDNRAHTSNSLDVLQANLEGYAGAALYVDSLRAVSVGGVVTAAGSRRAASRSPFSDGSRRSRPR